MKIGFTGTQLGMSDAQKRIFESFMRNLRPEEFHHGDCIGADAEAHVLSRFHSMWIIIHPPTNPKKRAFCGQGDPFTKILPPKEYLARNEDIVHDTDILLACPKGDEELRSGTWSTIRRARRLKKDYTIIWPNGSLEKHTIQEVRKKSVIER